MAKDDQMLRKQRLDAVYEKYRVCYKRAIESRVEHIQKANAATIKTKKEKIVKLEEERKKIQLRSEEISKETNNIRQEIHKLNGENILEEYRSRNIPGWEDIQMYLSFDTSSDIDRLNKLIEDTIAKHVEW